MIVGVLCITLRFPGCRSLKEKRASLRPLIAGIQHTFHASVAEVADQNACQQGVIGVSKVFSDKKILMRELSKIKNWINIKTCDSVLAIEEEIIHY